MTRREKAIELGCKIGADNRDNPKAVETLTLVLDQWRNAVARNEDGWSVISHEKCVACDRHHILGSGCCDCPFVLRGQRVGFCTRFIRGALHGDVVITNSEVASQDVSVSAFRRFKADVVACLEAAVEAAEERGS